MQLRKQRHKSEHTVYFFLNREPRTERVFSQDKEISTERNEMFLSKFRPA